MAVSERAPRTHLTCHRSLLDADAAEDPSGGVVCVGDGVVGSLVGRDGSRCLFWRLPRRSLQGFCPLSACINDLPSEMKTSFQVYVRLTLGITRFVPRFGLHEHSVSPVVGVPRESARLARLQPRRVGSVCPAPHRIFRCIYQRCVLPRGLLLFLCLSAWMDIPALLTSIISIYFIPNCILIFFQNVLVNFLVLLAWPS